MTAMALHEDGSRTDGMFMDNEDGFVAVALQPDGV